MTNLKMAAMAYVKAISGVNMTKRNENGGGSGLS